MTDLLSCVRIVWAGGAGRRRRRHGIIAFSGGGANCVCGWRCSFVSIGPFSCALIDYTSIHPSVRPSIHSSGVRRCPFNWSIRQVDANQSVICLSIYHLISPVYSSLIRFYWPTPSLQRAESTNFQLALLVIDWLQSGRHWLTARRLQRYQRLELIPNFNISPVINSRR